MFGKRYFEQYKNLSLRKIIEMDKDVVYPDWTFSFTLSKFDSDFAKMAYDSWTRWRKFSKELPHVFVGELPSWFPEDLSLEEFSYFL